MTSKFDIVSMSFATTPSRPLQYGTALVLIALVMGMNLIAVIYRSRLRKKRA